MSSRVPGCLRFSIPSLEPIATGIFRCLKLFRPLGRRVARSAIAHNRICRICRSMEVAGRGMKPRDAASASGVIDSLPRLLPRGEVCDFSSRNYDLFMI